MASNKRINKAYVRYDGSGRVIAGSLILNRFKPQVGNWSEIPAYECCNSAPVLALRLLFSNISEVDAIVGDSSNVSDWNTFFDLPAFGTPFTSVSVTGNEVKLYGGSGINLKDSLFGDSGFGLELLEINDDAGSIVSAGYDVFGNDNGSGCTNLTTVYLPELLTAGDLCFLGTINLINVSMDKVTSMENDCFNGSSALSQISFPALTSIGSSCFNGTILDTINIPSCTNLGATVGLDNVFIYITGNTITLTVPAALMTCNSGNPDGDIQYLQANNTVTIITT